jgi:large exoprotein involved in heme utilization and adhesion
LISDAAITNWIAIDAENETRSIQSVSSNPNNPTPQPIVEASGWVINAKGEVFLTADASTVTPHSSWRPATHCGVKS